MATTPLDTVCSATLTKAFDSTVITVASTTSDGHCERVGSGCRRQASQANIKPPAISMRVPVSRNGG